MRCYDGLSVGELEALALAGITKATPNPPAARSCAIHAPANPRDT
jgi:hypothetical protein